MEKLLSIAKMLSKPPPPAWDPTKHTMRGWIKKFRDVWNAEGFGVAYNKLRMESHMRGDGQLVGIDTNGNQYYENKNKATGHSRWVEYPTPKGVWAIDDQFDPSMVTPDWHGWLHYMHDAPGSKVSAEHSKPFKEKWRMNQTMLRPFYTTTPGTTSKDFSDGEAPAFHQPPGAWKARVSRGRLGPKYQAWDPSGAAPQSALRNYADNAKTLHIE